MALASSPTRSEATASGPVLRLDHVVKSFGSKRALDDVSLAVPENSYVSLLGASGSGKTVLLRAIAGFDAVDGGSILLRGSPMNAVPAYLRNIGTVFQTFALFPHLDVFENIAFGLRNAAGAGPEARTISDRVRAMVDLVGLGGLERRAVTAISGGQRQRVALARTLVTEPRLVLLDEPLGALDANLRTRMCGELRRIRERLGVTFLHVTGSETEALSMGDQVIVLDGGHVAQVGPPQEVYTRPRDARVARFLNCYNLIEGCRDGTGFVAEGLVLPCAQIGPASADVYALRQDLIDVRPSGTAAGPHFPATFVASEYSGPAVTSFFKLPSGAVVTVEDHLSHREPPTFEPGGRYDLTWRIEDALLLARRAEARA